MGKGPQAGQSKGKSITLPCRGDGERPLPGTEAEYMPPAEFGKLVEKDIAKWTAVVKKANIKLE